MKAIQVVIEHMNDTLKEANEYYRDYVMFKESQPKVAQLCIEMAQTHLSLYNKWHELIVYIINEYKEKGNEIPKTMQEIYDYKHKKLVEEYDALNFKVRNAR